MAELFTEEDVRRYRLRVACAIAGADVADYIDVSLTGAIADAAIRSILSALAEDGRLRPEPKMGTEWRVEQGGWAYYAESREEATAMLAEHRAAGRSDAALESRRPGGSWEPAESGGALPSDTPALADAYAAAAAALAGYATEPYGDLRLNAERASAKAVTAALSVLGLVNHSADPVSVLEEETGR